MNVYPKFSDVSLHIDEIAEALLAHNEMSTIIDMGRLVIEFPLTVEHSTHRALVNRVFHADEILAKQLHQYGTYLGVYNQPKVIMATSLILVHILSLLTTSYSFSFYESSIKKYYSSRSIASHIWLSMIVGRRKKCILCSRHYSKIFRFISDTQSIDCDLVNYPFF